MTAVGPVASEGGLRHAVREAVELYAQAVDARELNASAAFFGEDAALAVPVDVSGAEFVERAPVPPAAQL